MSVHASSTHAISLNPATGEVFAEYPFEQAADLERSLARAAAGFSQWRRQPVSTRAAQLRAIAQVLRHKADALARMMTAEMGKPIAQARAEVEKTAVTCEWYAEHGPAMLAPEKTPVENDKAYIDYLPLGPILAVMPWNFPIWQVMRSAIPMILAGNTYVLKHAPNVMGSAYLLREAWAEAGLPEGVFEVINVGNEGVSSAIADPRIAAVAVTGSVRAGAAIAAQAGAALKKCVLELGGSDPFIVLADADLDEAVKAATVGRYQNSGQICVAAKRIIVEESVLPVFTEKFVAAVNALKVGDPLDEAHYIGPMARYDLRDELHGQVLKTLEEGATLLLGGEKLPGKGNYYAPTVLANVRPGMTSFKEELFGPVASLIAARDADHAVALANDSEFGLAGSVWSADVTKARDIAARLETGGVFINGYTASDARVPIGGVKKSGFGRELSHFGIREFCNAQTVWLDRR
ncbi:MULTISPECIES: aldehyde dehydrogenase family protein [unclassified Pseudomonas]|uniref:aldehyde dehydrogenase family protein n=1 Tax=unclassified Pseudomonas TaxID=196821 RepID=UPI000D36BD00|nr:MULTISPECIES: aldehyde dehydrogenase family protein [unclassified Pseudomonas]RAU45540.1 succinate-semialdehyde dehydrogenase [Pseudomonas sp. RIT 409]RAU53077.1 succinate-semialdehyde dehydrogenase [Pseudomonas sp. RIT 412]